MLLLSFIISAYLLQWQIDWKYRWLWMFSVTNFDCVTEFKVIAHFNLFEGKSINKRMFKMRMLHSLPQWAYIRMCIHRHTCIHTYAHTVKVINKTVFNQTWKERIPSLQLKPTGTKFRFFCTVRIRLLLI